VLDALQHVMGTHALYLINPKEERTIALPSQE
jgi:hypothetical protein